MRDFEKPFQKRTFAAPDRILVATDLTGDDYLVPHAIAQAQASGGHVTLIHAVIPTDSLPVETAAIPFVDEAKIDRDIRLKLLVMASRIKCHGISCDVAVRHGYAADAIREEIKRTGATRLIMGTHGRGQFKRIALGSVFSDLLRTVNIPVFAIGPHAHGFEEHLSPRRILHPVSLAGEYRRSARFAIDLARSNRAELILLHVLERDTVKGADPGSVLDWAKNALAALIPDPGDLMPPVDTVVAYGDPIREILRVADSAKTDWIVLGADGKFSHSPFKDTTACKLLSATNYPVLTLRQEPYQVERAPAEMRFAIAMA